ncbi:MAG: phospholipid carrier-dependent glycosyltransferase, partial [Chloroflexota bacterium]|nr:phospholipid carrier-dependent glycosyltransferase [Chloroflexota bacterium]
MVEKVAQALGRNATLWWLGAILLVALALRLYGLDWDQGYLFHPDERAILMKTWDLSWPRDLAQFLDPNLSPLNTHWFPYGTFPLYLLKLLSYLVSLFNQGLTLFDARLLGRALSVLFDVGTVLLVFLLGSRFYGRRVGLLGAGLVALAILHIQLSHFYATDGLLTFFIVLTVLALLGATRKAGIGSAALAGLGLGLALATKISALPLLLPVALAYGIYAFSREGDTFSWAPSEVRLKAALRGLAITLAVAAAVFLIAEPYALLDWKTFRSDIVEQSEMVRRVRDYPYTRQYVDTPSYLYQVEQLATWGLGLPLGLVAWGGLAFTLYSAWRRRGKADLLLLSWVVPYFLVIGSFQVKFLRYLLPLTPFLILMGANMLFRGTDWARDKRVTPRLRAGVTNGLSRWGWVKEKGYWLVGLVIPLVVLLSLFYSLAYVSIYSQPHPAVRASQWLRQNAPAGATILKEHWEEGLPALGAYRVKELNLYDPDGAQKLEHLTVSLSEGDYLVLYSNRLYGTIPRLRERYPLTSHYYQLLFSGELGYELAYFAVSYPRFLGLELVDDTFQRPRLPEPAALASYQGSPLTLRWGAADESFTVYDHPKVMVFRKTKTLPRGELMQRLSQMGTTSQRQGLLLSEDEARAQREGGTWSQLFPRDSLPNRFPVLSWLLLV